MTQYLSLIKEILKDGIEKSDRTGVGTISKFGTQRRYDLTVGFPLVTTKKVHFKSVVHELLWFIQGQTNIKYLVDNDVRIWNEWPFEKFKLTNEYQNESIDDFVLKIKNDANFAQKYGDLGPVYGRQWRDFNGVDQLQKIIEQLKNNPNSRRIILSAWNVSQVDEMALPPCHAFVQFYVQNNQLSCHLYQRSADIFLGVPFNIASYALLTHMLAHVTNLEAKELIHTTGDTHIYHNHFEGINLQLTRCPKPLPKLVLNPLVKNLFDFRFEDIELKNYEHHPLIKAQVAV